MKKEEANITFCPNCGKPVEAWEYYSFRGIAMGMIGTPDPISSRFLCGRCNYGGLPLQATIEGYKGIDFSNWKMLPAPIQTIKPLYKFLLKLTILILAGLFSIMIIAGSFSFFDAATCIVPLAILFFLFTIYKLFFDKK